MFFSSLVTATEIFNENLTYQITSEYISLEIRVPDMPSVRVWHSTNPMKIIIDLDHSYQERPQAKRVNDVALKEIRLNHGPGAVGTRIVMDFNYLLPDYRWEVDGSLLKLVVDKVYTQSTVNTVSRGVRYGHERRGIDAGPLVVNYLEVRYHDPAVEIRSVLAQDRIHGRERVSSMATRSRAIAAVNGLFFASDGRPLGLLAIDQQLISEPYANRTAIGIKQDEVRIDAVGFNGSVTRADGHTLLISGFNRPRLTDELIIYTPDFGDLSRTNIYGVDLIVIDGVVMGKVDGGATIPKNGLVVSGHGVARDFLREVEIGDYLQLEVSLTPDWLEQGFEHIIGGGPRLVKNGVVSITGEQEQFQADVLRGRAPRTALGITADNRLLLVTVNGRQPGISIGLTLHELAELMIDLGAIDAMNLDGGGSTTMVIRNQVLNLPSDGIERSVSNALVVITPDSRE